MAHAFKTIPAKPAFGTLTKPGYQSDYISNKKANMLYYTCDKKTCNKLTKAPNYHEYNLFYKKQYLNNNKMLPFDKTNLIAGLYAKMNLKNICAVSNGNPCSLVDSCAGCETGAIVDLSSSQPFYQVCTIDPLGELFGRSACGTNNFTSYMVYSPEIYLNSTINKTK
jgi:hypothetical protein